MDAEYFKRYYLQNREKILARAKQRHRKNRKQKAAYDQKRRALLAGELRAYDRARYYEVRKRSLGEILRRAKQRAKKLGIKCTIAVADLPPIPKRCPVLDIPIDFNFGRGGKDNSISIDRIVDSRGYVPGNVGFISLRANRLKAGLTYEQARRLVAYMTTPRY